MPIEKVLRNLLERQKIRRQSWPELHHIALIDARVVIRNEDGYHPWLITSEDLIAEDWMTI